MIPLLLTGLLSAAWASFPYPDALQSNVGGACTPQCTVCHATNSGGGGTVTMDFGKAMMVRGLSGGSDSASLAAAVDQMTTDEVDSDGDGTLDVDELALGDDPNPGGLAFCDIVTPQYGCVSVVPRPPRWSMALVGFTLAAWTVRRRASLRGG